jgi:anti-sigma factor ChrR (cupin superfamily)
MNCTEVRELLAGVAYGDAASAEASAVHQHLASCSTCQAELEELDRVRRTLDAIPGPAPVSIDLARLFQQAAAHQKRRMRRWRRAAAAVCGLAAALLLVLLLRMEIRIEAHELVLRWGEKPPESLPDSFPKAEPTVIVRREVIGNPEMEEQLRVIRETLHALAGNLDARDAVVRQKLGQLETRLEAVRRQDGQRWNETERNVAALYKAVFILPKRGENQ